MSALAKDLNESLSDDGLVERVPDAPIIPPDVTDNKDIKQFSKTRTFRSLPIFPDSGDDAMDIDDQEQEDEDEEEEEESDEEDEEEARGEPITGYTDENINEIVGDPEKAEQVRRKLRGALRNLRSSGRNLRPEMFDSYLSKKVGDCQAALKNEPLAQRRCSEITSEQEKRRLVDKIISGEITHPVDGEWSPLEFTVLLDLMSRVYQKGGKLGIAEFTQDLSGYADDSIYEKKALDEKRRFDPKTAVNETKSDVHRIRFYRTRPPKDMREMRNRQYIDGSGRLDMAKFQYVVKSLIIDKLNLQYPEAAALLGKNGCDQTTTLEDVILSQAQAFVIPFVDPRIFKTKGIIVWANTGLGKTCMGMLMTALWEMESKYRIVFVTQKTLKFDVLKNVYDTTCFIPFLAKAAKDPGFANAFESMKTRSKQEQLNFLRKHSRFDILNYEEAMNLMSGRFGKYRDQGFKGNDPIAKTFMIFDEVHSTNDDDLKTTERIRPEDIFEALYKSIETSGDDSVRFAFLSATPWGGKTAHIVNAFQLVYLCRGRRLPQIFADQERFNEVYLAAKTAKVQGDPTEFNKFVEFVWDKFGEMAEPVVLYLDLSTDTSRYPVFSSFQTVMYTLPPRQVEEMNDIGKDINPKRGPTPEQARRLLAHSLAISLRSAKVTMSKQDTDAIRKNIDLISPAAVALMERIASIDAENVRKRGHVGKHIIFMPVESSGAGVHTLEEFYDICIALNMKPSFVEVDVGNKRRLFFNKPSNVDYTWKNSANKWRHAAFLTEGTYHGLSMDTIQWDDPVLNGMKNGIEACKKMWNFRAGDDGTEEEKKLAMSQLGQRDKPTSGNNYGQVCRFLFVSWKFRNGWDSKDNVALHYFGDPEFGDLVQMIGRVQRTCSNAGIEHEGGKGWGVDVVHYTSVLPPLYTKPALIYDTKDQKQRNKFVRRAIDRRLASMGIGTGYSDGEFDEDYDDDTYYRGKGYGDEDDGGDGKYFPVADDEYSSKVRAARQKSKGVPTVMKAKYKFKVPESEYVMKAMARSPGLFNYAKEEIARGYKRYEALFRKPRRNPDSRASVFLKKADSFDAFDPTNNRLVDNDRYGWREEDLVRTGGSQVANSRYLIPKKLRPAKWTAGEERLHAVISKFRNVNPSDLGLDPLQFGAKGPKPSLVAQDTILVLGPILKLVAMTTFMNRYLSGKINNPFAPPVTGKDLTIQSKDESWERFTFINKIKEAVRSLPNNRPSVTLTRNKGIIAHPLTDRTIEEMATAFDSMSFDTYEEEYLRNMTDTDDDDDRDDRGGYDDYDSQDDDYGAKKKSARRQTYFGRKYPDEANKVTKKPSSLDRYSGYGDAMRRRATSTAYKPGRNPNSLKNLRSQRGYDDLRDFIVD